MIHITNHAKDRKMENMQSINTNPLTNKFCIASSKKDMVCKKCYARRQMSMYNNMVKPLQSNSELLSQFKLKTSDVPIINAQIFRFNSFGELINELHFKNLCIIAYLNPETTFSLWTKCYKIVQKYFDYGRGNKPENLILIHSSYVINKEEPLPKWFDKVFTVYDRCYASVNEIPINCHSKCNECRMCYTKNTNSFLRELIK